MKAVNDVISVFQEAVQRYGDQPFLLDEDHSYSFVEIEQLTNKFSNGLRHFGVKQGDHVAFCLEGSVEVVVTRLAVQKLGAVIIPISNRLIGPEIEYILRDSDTDWVVVGSSFLPEFQQMAIASLLERTIVVGDVPPGIKAVSYRDVINKGESVAPTTTIDPESAAMILYTSGTTGLPKGAVIRHRNSVASAQCQILDTELRHNDILLSSTAMYMSSSLNAFFIGCMMMGVRWVLTRRFSPRDVLEKIERFRATIYFAAGPLIVMVMNHESFSYRDLSSLRLVGWSNILPSASLQKLRKALPNTDMWHVYGLTETTTLGTHILLKDLLERPGSCGKLDPEFGSFRVVDEQGRDQPPGETGEIIYQGKGLMREYYNNPEATKDAMKNGWFNTGDLGRFDEDGYLYIIGRTKDMINRGGEKVYGPEVEEVLYQHPAVLEAAVVGMHHEVLGEEVKAFVVLRKGAQLTQDEVITHCQGRIAHFKIPKEIEFREDLPKNSSGKILKYELVPGK